MNNQTDYTNNLVEVTFNWSSIKLRWYRKDNWYVIAHLVGKDIIYHGQLAESTFRGRECLKNPDISFPTFIDKFKEYK